MGKTLDDIGIYTNIHESGHTVSDGHKLYYATCKLCGTVVEKRLADIEAFKEKASEPVNFINVKTNETINFPSLKEACRALSLNLRNAWMVLSDKYPEHHTIKGWKIYKA